MDKVDKLYQNYECLADPSNKPSEHESEYLEILLSSKGTTSEKMLACQFIPRFLKEFPHLASKALDAQLDLVEDDDVSIRKHAVKHLPSFCKESKEFVTKIADVLTQLLQSEDSGEIAAVQTALMTILKMDVKRTAKGIFVQIAETDDDSIRKRAIQFLTTKFKFLSPELTPKDVEEYVLELAKNAFDSITGEDFLNLLPLLTNMKIAKTIPVQQALVGIIAEQAELGSDFHPDSEQIAGFMQCMRQAMPFFSPFVSSSQFVNYMCLLMLPKLEQISELEGGPEMSLNLLKLLAEISPFYAKNDQVAESTEMVYEVLLKYIPLPPSVEVDKADEPNLQFSHIECLMFAFMQLLKHHPDFLSESSDRLKDLKARLQFLARGVQNGIKTFKESLVKSKSVEVKAEETKLKAMALRTMNNINSLVKDLFRSPPSLKSGITLSWKPVTASVSKRVAEESPEKKKLLKRDGREIYTPPGGKYSTNVSYNRNFYPRGRGRGRRFY